jgi:hypothetical protein
MVKGAKMEQDFRGFQADGCGLKAGNWRLIVQRLQNSRSNSEVVILMMNESMNKTSAAAVNNNEIIPEEVAVEIRRLAHNLSNALEIIVQTSFLLSTAELKEPASDWMRMLEGGVQKALDLNLELRQFVKAHTAE